MKDKEEDTKTIKDVIEAILLADDDDGLGSDTERPVPQPQEDTVREMFTPGRRIDKR